MPRYTIMFKKILAILPILLLTGCATTFTRLTPLQQPRNPNNLYPVEVAFNTRQQSLRWKSIQPYIMVGSESYPMRQTPRMKNRWEGLLPVPPGVSMVKYRYKFDFQYTEFGGPSPDSASSPEYILRVFDQ